MATKKILSGVSQPALGSAPYADMQEVTGPPTFEIVPEPYRPFFATDARTVMIILHPNHYNFIINPAFRVDASGWEVTAATNSLDAGDSWVGQSMRVSGATGSMRYREGVDKFIYVGPTVDLDQQDWYEPGRSSAQWTFTAYVKGAARIATGPFDPPARVRLAMEAYRPIDPTVSGSPPTNINLPQIANPATSLTAAAPKVLGGNGHVWERNEPSFYAPIGKVPTSAVNPTTIVATGPKPPTDPLLPFLLYSGNIYRLKTPLPETAGVSYYVSVGAPTTVTTDPREMLPAQNYLLLNLAGDPRDGEHWEITAPPYYHDTGSRPYFASVQGQWHDLKGTDWDRLTIRTDAWTAEGEGKVSFAGCFWIDARLEFENCADLRVSAFMLDPTELFSQYFDGSMTEDTLNDDFIWSKVYAETGDYVTQKANACVSYYYYDRMARTRWLWENLKFVVPVDRPYQIFFGSFDRPYIPPRGQSVSATATRTLTM